MNQDSADRDLNQLLDRELRALPGPRAPRTLMPRVLAAAAAAERRAASASGWSTWPAAWRAASAVVGVAGVTLLAWLLMAPAAPLADARTAAGEGVAVMRVLWDAVLQPVSGYLLVVGVVFALACAAVWAALESALGGASQ